MLSGDLKIRAHYFEMGNMQFNLDKKYEPVQLKGSDGVSICEKINELETAYQLSVDEVLEMTKEGMMKKMRRTIPVSGQKFDWDKPKMML